MWALLRNGRAPTARMIRGCLLDACWALPAPQTCVRVVDASQVSAISVVAERIFSCLEVAWRALRWRTIYFAILLQFAASYSVYRYRPGEAKKFGISSWSCRTFFLQRLAGLSTTICIPDIGDAPQRLNEVMREVPGFFYLYASFVSFDKMSALNVINDRPKNAPGSCFWFWRSYKSEIIC